MLSRRSLLAVLIAAAGWTATGRAAEPATPSPRVTGRPLVRTFDEHTYGASARNVAVRVHPNGLVYAGNDSGLLEYDGVRWRQIAGTGGDPVSCVEVDPKGRVWYCGLYQFGVLAPDASGTLVAEDWRGRLPADFPTVRNIRQIALLGERVFLLSAGSRSVLWAEPGGRVAGLGVGETCLSLFACEGAVYLLTAARVVRVDRGTAEPAPELTAALRTAERLQVYRAWPRAGGGTWLATPGGVRLWHEGRLAPLSGEVRERLGGRAVAGAAPLPDGTFALGSLSGELLIVDPAGPVIAGYGEAQGFGAEGGAIHDLATDAEGGLWVARRTGLARAEVGGAAAWHGSAQGLRGTVQAMVMHRGRLFVSTNAGLFQRDPATGAFAPVAGGSGDIHAMVSADDGLWLGGGALWWWPDGGRRTVVDDPASVVRSLLLVRDGPERLVAGSSQRLRIFRRDGGSWRLEREHAGLAGVPYRLIRDRAGWVWADLDARRMMRVDWRGGVRLDAPVEVLDAAHGYDGSPGSDGELRMTMFDGEAVAVGVGGIWRHDARSDRFVPEGRIAGLNGRGAWPRVHPLSDGSIWLGRTVGQARLARARPTGPGRWKLEAVPFTGMEWDRPLMYCEDPAARTLWVGYIGVASYDLARPAPTFAPPVARLRELTAAGSRRLWGGAGEFRPAPFAHDHNEFGFAFAAATARTDARGAERTHYRTWLEGFDADWSAWGSAVSRRYTNLPPGRFVFHVQARGGDWRPGPVATYAFTILPPWWSTWWFRAAAAAAAFAAVAGIARWYARRVLRRRLALVEARSAVERERLRLARDLHDEVGSGLGRVLLFADEAERARAEPVRQAESLARLRGAARDLLGHAREIVWAVSPQHDALPSVVERLGDYVEETLRAAGIACAVELPAADSLPAATLGSEARHSLFLAVKEAVHNCVKYSRAATAEFRLAVDGAGLVVTLRDHGVGFAPGEIRGTGYGLPGLAARARALGGEARIESAPGRGTTVRLRVPFVEVRP